MTDAIRSPAVNLQRQRDVELVRSWLLQYDHDRLGRCAPAPSRVLVHDALDRLGKGA
jgi:hypothetical protein